MADLVSKQSFVVGRRVVRKGAIVASSDAIVKGREHLFEAAEAPKPKPEPVRPTGRKKSAEAPKADAESDD